MIKVLFFGRLRDELQADQLSLDMDQCDVSAVRHALSEQFSKQKDLLSRERALVAVNQDMATEQTPIKSGDEVAFFPPVTGG